LLLDGGREALPVPEGFEVEQFPDAVELDEIPEFGDCVRDDVGAEGSDTDGCTAECD